MGIRATPSGCCRKMPILGWRFDAVDAWSGSERLPALVAWCTDCSAIPPESWPRRPGTSFWTCCGLAATHPLLFGHPAAEKLRQADVVYSLSHDVAHAALGQVCPPASPQPTTDCWSRLNEGCPTRSDLSLQSMAHAREIKRRMTSARLLVSPRPCK